MVEREAAVLERGDHPAQRPRLAEQQVHAAADDLVVVDFEQRLLGELERRLEVGARVREPDEDVGALVSGRKLVEQLSQDRVGATDRAGAEVRVGERELPAREVDLRSRRRALDRELEQLRRRARRTSRERVLRSLVERRGDLGVVAVRREREMTRARFGVLARPRPAADGRPACAPRPRAPTRQKRAARA